MVRMLSEMRQTRVSRYSLCFAWKAVERTGAGFSFPCGADGEVITAEMLPSERRTLLLCLDGTHDVRFDGIRDESYTIIHPAVGICDRCGQRVTLYSLINRCACGEEYAGPDPCATPAPREVAEVGEVAEAQVMVGVSGG
jgi:hypothetical protein